MAFTAELMRRLSALQLSGEDFQEVLAIVAESHASDDARRAKDRDRKRVAKPSAPNPEENPRKIRGKSEEKDPIPSRTRAFFMGEEVKEERKEERKEEKVLLTQDSLPEVGNPVIDLKTKKNEIVKRERRAELLAFGEQWNAMAARFNLKTIDSIKAGSAREKQALARLQELKSEYHSNIEVFLRKISSSLFLTGRKTDFVASFDWVIKAANFTKIMEDNYENQKRGTQELNGRPYQRA